MMLKSKKHLPKITPPPTRRVEFCILIALGT